MNHRLELFLCNLQIKFTHILHWFLVLVVWDGKDDPTQGRKWDWSLLGDHFSFSFHLVASSPWKAIVGWGCFSGFHYRSVLLAKGNGNVIKSPLCHLLDVKEDEDMGFLQTFISLFQVIISLLGTGRNVYYTKWHLQFITLWSSGKLLFENEWYLVPNRHKWQISGSRLQESRRLWLSRSPDIFFCYFQVTQQWVKDSST